MDGGGALEPGTKRNHIASAMNLAFSCFATINATRLSASSLAVVPRIVTALVEVLGRVEADCSRGRFV